MLKENKYMFSFNLNYIFVLNVEWKSVQFNTWLKVMNRPPDVRLDLWYKCYRRFFFKAASAAMSPCLVVNSKPRTLPVKGIIVIYSSSVLFLCRISEVRLAWS